MSRSGLQDKYHRVTWALGYLTPLNDLPPGVIAALTAYRDEAHAKLTAPDAGEEDGA